ncbi:hypothetical protein I4U23_024920 [Adineta vaga]|nr:hypothetical protein I4U23_024920 [Adineta vaga]
MQQRKFLLNFHLLSFILCFNSIRTNLCPATPSCNCTLLNNTDLNIICNTTVSLTQLPSLDPITLQSTVTSLRVISSTTGAIGPLIRLPTNICSYTSLAILDLSSNNINGLLNTSELICISSTLISLDFSSNSIQNINLNLLKSTRVLKSIDLSYNNLTTMPIVDPAIFVQFPSTFVSLNISFNQLINVDLWPLFVKTKNTMTIDLSHNLIQDYTNLIPVSVQQLTETPDPRYFYLNNNRLTYLSDLLLEQYDACSIDSSSRAFFIVGISNILLTQNQLICDCASYNLITYINENLNDFPDIFNGSALLTQTICSDPNGQKYLSTDFSQYNNCENYVLPNISNIFCSVAKNDTRVTLTPPTYWPTTTTTATSNGYETDSNVGTGGSSTSIAWYIILGIILGIVLILAIVIVVCYLCRYRFCPKKYHSNILSHVRTDGNNNYEAMTHTSMNSSQKNSTLNDTKPQRASMSTSVDGFDGTERSSKDGGLHSNLKARRHRKFSNNDIHPDQETQTNVHPNRPKLSNGRLLSTRHSQQPTNTDRHSENSLPLPAAIDVATNTANGVKGIPISALPIKPPPTSPHPVDTSTSELSITSIPIAPSKRAKILPQIKVGNLIDATNDNLLNTSAGASITSQRQRRRSSLWTRKQHQNMMPPLPPRPQSMITHRTNFDNDESFDDDLPAIPTVESLTNKSSKPLRTVPLLNISVVPAWVDQTSDELN